MKLSYYKETTKYVVTTYWEYKLKLNYNDLKPFDNGKFFLAQEGSDWIIGCYPGFRTDGVTCWFDNKFLLKASFGHDILCNLIAAGHMSERYNKQIDHEFELIILEDNKDYPWWKGGSLVKQARARLARRGTNLSNARAGREPQVYTLL